MEQQETNPRNTIYDAKRFIGKVFDADDPNFLSDKQRYPFRIELDVEGRAYFIVEVNEGEKYVLKLRLNVVYVSEYIIQKI